MPHSFFRASDYQLSRRASVIAFLALVSFMILAVALAKLAAPPNAAPARPVVTARGPLLSADGRILAGGPLQARRYPHGSLAAPIVGFVGASGGLEGAERAYDGRLGRGEALTLTLDTRVQAAVERVLEDAVRRTDAQFASAVVMETRTGNLTAMASVPGFDLNRWPQVPPDRWRNRAALDEYEPGSVVKALTVAALLNEGRTTPDTVYDTPMWRRYAGATINDIVPHPGQLRTRQILRYSSNVGMTRLVEDVPPEVLHRYFSAYGFGRPVRLGLPTGDGLLRDPEDWGALSQATMAFGQGLTVTTLQLAAAFNVLANGGRYVAPRLVVGAPTGSRAVLSRATAASMREMLHGVIDEGIRAKAELPGYHVGGKTGTAQVAVDGRYSGEVFSSTFGGFVPAGQPRFTVAVMVRGAKREYQGSQLAAPIFRDVTSALLSLHAVRPDPGP
ncbi:peptidoglycan D,D-transpeptidase FtsI family protein [Deinococcus metallilatus]|uniref:Cell division protein FtsI (Penicillin-binding protein 3) n=2 Tax=Deinococcus metallilatus TaxID=1211322 RepID=A0ABR6MP10_9DEIO|nr:penicillin-binding protein 2 [Deinococcus metallilatus]MBB5293675.1 cell division protein FtsI (penicillin-binding protein 3) [Deinococcus metallilatus]GMA17605.1 penicillin-binding protein 2 [Deinococcus metallilatus]